MTTGPAKLRRRQRRRQSSRMTPLLRVGLPAYTNARPIASRRPLFAFLLVICRLFQPPTYRSPLLPMLATLTNSVGCPTFPARRVPCVLVASLCLFAVGRSDIRRGLSFLWLPGNASTSFAFFHRGDHVVSGWAVEVKSGGLKWHVECSIVFCRLPI